MTKVRDSFWILKLRQNTKRVLKACHGCKRLYKKLYPNPKPRILPKDRTKENLPFKLTDCADLIYCKVKTKQTQTYILLFTSSITRAVPLELLPTHITSEFIKTFQILIARRGSTKNVYSNNARTYVAATKWVQNITTF